jgi:3-methyl-2-oxobutanoate hydroxymethyltransferase
MSYSINDFIKEKNNSKIAMITCYDFTFAKIAQDAGIKTILVGDSLGMVIKGEENTLNVTIEEVAYHVKAVKKGSDNTLIIGDMPYLSYHIDPKETVKNAGLLIKAGANAVKLEGGRELEDHLDALKMAKIPVLGHVGLTPQSVNVFGGFLVQGKNEQAAKEIIEDAKFLESKGVFGIVLEAVPAKLAKIITRSISIPTIGIGAGYSCDGQVLVMQDLLGLNPDFVPKFSKQFTQGYEIIKGAFELYSNQVKNSDFPTDKHSFKIDDSLVEMLDKLY